MIATTGRISMAAIAAAMALAVSMPPARADDAPPATAPLVTRPAAGLAANPFDLGPASRKAILPLPPAQSVEDGLKYDQDEKEILAAVRDHTRQLTDSGLYVLLRRAASLPQLDAGSLASLNQISGTSLMNSPEKYRGEPLHMTMRVYKMRPWTPGVEFKFNDRWPKDKPIWWMAGLEGTYKNKDAKRIVVLSLVDPKLALGEEDKPGESGEYIYNSGRQIDLAGIFYKTYSDQPASSQGTTAPMQDFPVIVAWQVERSGSIFGSTPWYWWVIFAGVSVLIVIGIVFFGNRLKASLRGGRGDRRFQSFRHKRVEEARQAALLADEQKVEEVDQALKEAAEQFKKDKAP
ncbi:MAG: hypothetical protein ACE15C_14030 [Phycisphaerae bacterium]